MSRRRYISTDTSTDKRFNRLVNEYGTLAGMMYLLLIPHAEDDCTITGDVDEIMMKVIPGLRSVKKADVEKALKGMCEVGILYQKFADVLSLPPRSFYKYQTYIPLDKRITDENAEERRRSAINTASPSLSPSPSPTPSPLVFCEQPDECMRLFNSICTSLTKIKAMTEPRKITLKAWGCTKEEAEEHFRRVQASSFLTGENDKGWVADYDWIMKPINRQKILEGKYSNKGKIISINGTPKRDCFEQREYSDEFFEGIANASLKKQGDLHE